jgi:hypothetical protein
MVYFARRALLVAFIGMMAASQAAQAQSGDPVAMVRQIFETYSKDGIPRVPWSPAVAARMRTADISADPILSAQDTDVKGYTVREVSRGADRAVVEANFTSFDRKMRSQFDFRLVDGKWVIGNYRILAGVEFAPTDFRRSLKMPPLN